MTPTAYLVVTASFRTSLLWHSSFNVTLDPQDGAEHRRNDFARVVSTAPSHASLYKVASFSVRTRRTLQRTTEKHSRRDQNCRKDPRNKKWSSHYREFNEASLIIGTRPVMMENWTTQLKKYESRSLHSRWHLIRNVYSCDNICNARNIRKIKKSLWLRYSHSIPCLRIFYQATLCTRNSYTCRIFRGIYLPSEKYDDSNDESVFLKAIFLASLTIASLPPPPPPGPLPNKSHPLAWEVKNSFLLARHTSRDFIPPLC